MLKTNFVALGRPHGVRWQADWLRFLERFPQGARLSGDRALPPWPRVTTPGKAPARANWLGDVAEITGASDLTRQLVQKRPSLHFWDQRLLRHAYPVARTHGGDPIVQVTSGRHAGHILLTNHDNWDGFFERLATLGTRRPAAHDEEYDDFQDEAGPVLRRLGYKGGAPTTDQVVGVLLHRDFDGATRIARSFRELYVALWRARQPARPARGKQRAVSILDLPSSARVIGADRERAYMGGPYGDALISVTADGTITSQRWSHGITGILCCADGVYVSDLGGLRLSRDRAGRPSTLLAGKVRSMAREGRGGLWLTVEKRDDVLLYSKTWRRFTPVRAPRGRIVVFGSGAGGVLGATFDQLFVASGGKPARVIATPQPGQRIDAAIQTVKGTLLAGASALMRSVDGGNTWRKVARLGDAGISGLFQTWTDEIIVAVSGKQIWLSRDDAASFQPVSVPLDDVAWSAHELAGKILVVAGSQLVRIAK
ncbi:MAG TPA: hypothetical protein VFX12_10120 [Vicinamibacterales bacterium]|nr:hypothetical protein [Vicinamibacterales bacterium]